MTDVLAKQAQRKVPNGGNGFDLSRNADRNRVIVYGVQVKMKPTVVNKIPGFREKRRRVRTNIAALLTLTSDDPSFHFDAFPSERCVNAEFDFLAHPSNTHQGDPIGNAENGQR